jgi:hypothetical protein
MEMTDKILKVVRTLNTVEFKVFEQGNLQLYNVDKFIVSNDAQYRMDWQDILFSDKMASMEVVNAYINMSLSPVSLKRKDIQEFFMGVKNLNFSFNVFNTGIHEYLKTPEVFQLNDNDNLLNFLPSPDCCDGQFHKANFKNSVIFSSKGFLTTVHRDVDTPGTNIVHLAKGRKLWIFLDNLDATLQLNSIEEFLDEIVTGRITPVVIDMVAGQTISFPMAAPHIVLTLENSIMPFWTFLSQHEIRWMRKENFWDDVVKENNLLLDLEFERRPTIRAIPNHACLRTAENIPIILELDTLNNLTQDLQSLSDQVAKKSLSHVIYSLNDIIFYVWKIISQSNSAFSFRKRNRTANLFTKEQSVLFKQNGLNEECLSAAYFCGRCIHDVLKFKAGITEKLEFGIKRKPWVLDALDELYLIAPTMFPMLHEFKRDDVEMTRTFYEAEKFKFIHTHLSLFTFRLLCNDGVSNFNRFEHRSIQETLHYVEQVLYYKRLLVPVQNVHISVQPTRPEDEEEENIYELYNSLKSDPDIANILERCDSYLKELNKRKITR